MDEKSLRINNKERLSFRNLLLIITLTSLFSCEGFKVLRLHNYSDNTAIVTIKPGYSKMEKYQISNYPNKSNRISDSITVELPRDSSIVLSSIFTSFLGGAKLKERDIRVSYLKIETEETLVVANSKKEILRLLDNDSFKYKRKLDKEKEMTNSKNFGNIIIRE